MSGSGVVLLLFSPYERHEQTWAEIRTTVIDQINQIVAGEQSKNPTQSRFLDQVPEAKSGAVTEVSTEVGKPITLQECKAITDSEWFLKYQAENKIELILLPSDTTTLLRSKPGLAVFDMDSTLIQQEVIDELARAVGLYDQVAAITEAAMRGEEPYTDFTASLRARVALLKGVPNSIWEKMKREIITFTPGAPELLRALKKLGWKTAVLSGGFTPLAYWVKDTLGLDYAHANELVSDPALEQLTGELVQAAPIIHGQKKRELLLKLAEENGIPPERCIAVGDGSNDLPMMGVAGLGIAFNAKPKVQLAAPAKINRASLLDVLYILGYTKQKIEDVISS